MKKTFLLLAVLLAPIIAQAQYENERGETITGFPPYMIDRAMAPWARSRVDANAIEIFTKVAGLRSGDSLFNRIQLNTNPEASEWTPGLIEYNSSEKTVNFGTGVQDVTIQGGQEVQYPLVINHTADTLFNGTPVFTSSVDANGVIEIDSAKANSPFTSLSTLGLVTADIPPDSTGFVTWFGKVRDIPTDGLIAGNPAYLAANGGKTSTKPLAPNAIVILGAVLVADADTGVIDVTIERFTRPVANRSYNFTSNGIGADTYYVAGSYDGPTDDANLTQVSPSVSFGTANNAYGAHAYIVAGGAGSVDAGQVGVYVIGTTQNDVTGKIDLDTAIITDDITSLSLNEYLETPEKFDSTAVWEFYTVSGSPATYSLDFNYGYAKYEDFGNVDFTVTGFEVTGLGGATDVSFDLTFLHHSSVGWIYAATGFIPGNTVIADWSDKKAPSDNIINNLNFACKWSELNYFVNGDSDEGVIVRIVTGQPNTIQSMSLHLTGAIESF